MLGIDALAQRRYPGTRADLARLQTREREQLQPLRNRASAAAHVTALAHLTKGLSAPMVLAQLRSAVLRDLVAVAAPLAGAGKRPRHCALAALRMAGMLEAAFGRAARAPSWRAVLAAAPAPDGADAWHDMPAEPGSASPEATQLNSDDAAVSASGKIASADIAAAAEESMLDLQGGHGLPRNAVADAARATVAGPRSYLYDEWDCHAAAYLRSWCRVFEHRLTSDRTDFLDAVIRRHAALFLEVRRQFGLLRPDARQRMRHAIDGDELDLDSVIETIIDRRAGLSPDARPYVHMERRRRDVAAAFLIDMSASTAVPLSTPDSGRRVLDAEKDALALMCSALHTLGDRFAVYGFSGDGRHNVEFQIAKEFRERMDARAWCALAAIEPRHATRMGAAIRHAAAKLAREPAGVRVLIMLSDGLPEDRDYGPARHDPEYGLQDTARALEEARRLGVQPFCVTIDPAGRDYLRRMCPASSYLVIDDIESLPRELSKLYRTLTA